jgi:hypothetical protein
MFRTIDLCVGKGTLCRSGILNFGAKRSIINPRINSENVSFTLDAYKSIQRGQSLVLNRG